MRVSKTDGRHCCSAEPLNVDACGKSDVDTSDTGGNSRSCCLRYGHYSILNSLSAKDSALS